MQTISLCMIVRDEAAVLERCLRSVAGLVEEIIIVDTGSTDNTKEIAARYTDKLYDFVWIDDFAAARNYSFEQATMDYCLWLDADDVLTEENQQKFHQLKESLDGSADVVLLPYGTEPAVGEEWPAFFYQRERLLRRLAGFRWAGKVHEAISPAGQCIYGDAAVTHCPKDQRDDDRNLRIYEAMLAKGEVLEPRQQYYYGRELCQHQQYERAAAVFTDFLQRGQGWSVNCIDACRLLAVCQQKAGQTELVLQTLLQALTYDVPDAGICCDLGNYFFEQQRYPQAIYWYERALQCKPQLSSGAFLQQDEYDYIPSLQLCVCYDRIGQWQQAERYNEQAAACKPMSEPVAHNRQYFQQYHLPTTEKN